MEKDKLQVEEKGEINHKPGQPKHCLWIILVLLGVALIALLAVVIALAVTLGIERQQEFEDVCLTDGCIQLSAQVAASLNQSVDPCVDFYEFACGNWLRTSIIEPGQGVRVRLLDGADQINVFLRKILEAGDDGGVTAVRKAIDLYSSCINIAMIEEIGATPMIELLNRTGGWSLIGLDESEPWSINSTTGFIYEKIHGSFAFFDIAFGFDSMNSSRWMPTLSQGSLTVDYTNNGTVNAYRNYIVRILTLLHPTGNPTTFEEAAENIISFERELSQISLSPTALRDVVATYNLFSLRDLPTLWPDFDWQALVDAIYNVTGFTTSEDLQFIVRTPSYFQNLSRIIQSTSVSTLRDYSKWMFTRQYLSHLSSDFRDAIQVFTAAVQGTQGTSPRTDTCIAEVQQTLPIALARPFVESYVTEGTKETMSMMINNIKDAFKNRLNELGSDWLDDESRRRSIEKVDAITQMVAYPDLIMDNNYVNGISENYMVDANDYFGNHFRKFEYVFKRNIRRMKEGIDKTRWLEELHPTDINAAYIPNLNQFVFLAGILRLPIFDPRWPEYFNFGSMGYVIGHELTHGFDDQGQQFDKDGIRRQWWEASSTMTFRERQTCFVDQYNQFTNQGHNVNGLLTLGENIADNGGINAAFRAYRRRVENGATQQRLPGLQYTPDQLFFVATGQVWCSLYTEQTAGLLASVSVHSPGTARVRGPLMNSEDFARVYNCAAGSPMNPPDKCIIW